MRLRCSVGVDRLIDALRIEGRLPLPEIVELQRTGHDVRIESRAGRTAIVAHRRDDRLDTLTRREHQVAGELALGATNRQIARRLDISVATVKDHVRSMLTKTGFQTRGELIAGRYGGLGRCHPESESGTPAGLGHDDLGLSR